MVRQNILNQLNKFGCLNPEDYVDVRTHNLKWYCKDCGKEYQRSLMHQKKGTGCCVDCYKDVNSTPKRIKKEKLTASGCLNPSEYKNNSTPNLRWVCSVCGTEYLRSFASQTASSTLGLCNECTIHDLSKRRKISTDSLIRVGCLNPSEYKNNSTPNLRWACSVCGTEYLRSFTAQTVKTSKGMCMLCIRTMVGDCNRARHEDVVASGILNPYDYINNSEKNMKYACDKCGSTFTSSYAVLSDKSVKKHFCSSCSGGVSSQEIEIVEFIESIYGGEILTNIRSVIPPKELDIYLPDCNIAIEVHGMYWHSSKFQKDKNIHYQKYVSCKDKGIQLLQFWAEDWVNKKYIIQSILRTKLTKNNSKVYARKCSTVVVTPTQAKEFLNTHHIQGYGTGASVYIGLEHKDSLQAVMCFKKTIGNIYDLTRFCTVQGITVVGGASKLLKYFITNYTPTEVTSFSDNMYSDGRLYETLGFKESSTIYPDYKYYTKGTLQHKFRFRHSVLKTKLKVYDSAITEKQNCANNGLYQVFDAGKIKWSLKC